MFRINFTKYLCYLYIFIARVEIDPYSSFVSFLKHVVHSLRYTNKYVNYCKSIVNWFVFVFSRFMKFVRVIEVDDGGKVEQLICTRDKVTQTMHALVHT